MSNVNRWLKESIFINPLSLGCKMCAKGLKLVVLITGLCPTNCYYCPLSKEKQGKDRIFADEWELSDENDTEKLILEARYIEATGAGITGGDPLAVWIRTKKYIKLLKDEFGANFHIHLYTSGIKNYKYINDLIKAGLDEIRFHPMPAFWNNMEKSFLKKSIRNSLDNGCDVAIEIPAIPNMENEIFSLVNWANDNNLCWVNLNELEFSETNANELNKKGFTVKDDISAAVKGSQETAYRVIEFASKENIDIGIHYCSSSFKDGIQLRNRIKRRAKNTAKKSDLITKDGTFLKGVVYSDRITLDQIYKILIEEFKVDTNLIFLNKKKNRIEIAAWILEKIASRLVKKDMKCFLIEEYPTADSLEVEKTPLPF